MSSAKLPSNVPTSPTLGQDLKMAAGMDPALAAQQAQGGGAPQDPSALMMPFSQFFELTGGDPEKAEAIVPGITQPDGVKKLVPGPDGRPHVQIPPEKAQEVQQLQQPQESGHDFVEKKFAELAERKRREAALRQAQEQVQKSGGAAKVPEYITWSDLKQLLGVPKEGDIDDQMFLNIYPGSDKHAGVWRYMAATPDGKRLLLNPLSAKYMQVRNDVMKQGAEASNE